MACLKIGPVTVGDRLEEVEAVLDVPTRITPMDDDTEARVYFIQQRSEPLPYYVITYVRKYVVAIQLYGPPTEMPQTFSALSLGDPQQKVLDVLGLPVKRCRVRERGFEEWTWQPFPFAVDIAPRTGQVVGLKVSLPREVER
jgi:hypothetical protein